MSEEKAALELMDVTKTFGGIKAVDGVWLSFSRGRITSLIGPNGAGKTTLFNLISGFLKPDRGQIFLNGRRIDGLPPWRIAQMGVGRLFQDVRVFDRLTVLDNVLLAKRDQPGERPWMPIFMRRKVLRAERENLEEARRWLEFVGLADKANAFAEDLSYGQQKLLSIARLLAGGFDVLLLDEPVAGVNPVMAREIIGIIRRLAEKGKTVVVIEHNMTVVLEISDWVYFMNDGKIVSFGSAADVLSDPEVRRAYLGVEVWDTEGTGESK